jgi:hypothetical protein
MIKTGEEGSRESGFREREGCKGQTWLDEKAEWQPYKSIRETGVQGEKMRTDTIYEP